MWWCLLRLVILPLWWLVWFSYLLSLLMMMKSTRWDFEQDRHVLMDGKIFIADLDILDLWHALWIFTYGNMKLPSSMFQVMNKTGWTLDQWAYGYVYRKFARLDGTSFHYIDFGFKVLPIIKTIMMSSCWRSFLSENFKIILSFCLDYIYAKLRSCYIFTLDGEYFWIWCFGLVSPWSLPLWFDELES